MTTTTMRPRPVPAGRVALDPRRLAEARSRRLPDCVDLPGRTLARTVATLATIRGHFTDGGEEAERLRSAGLERRPYILPAWRAKLYALALDCELSELLHDEVGA